MSPEVIRMVRGTVLPLYRQLKPSDSWSGQRYVASVGEMHAAEGPKPPRPVSERDIAGPRLCGFGPRPKELQKTTHEESVDHADIRFELLNSKESRPGAGPQGHQGHG